MYADWLEENGQPERAEFIRIQCDPTADEAAEARSGGSWKKPRSMARGTAAVPRLAVGDGATWEFRRGFPEFLATLIDDLFLERYQTPFARVPWLRFFGGWAVSIYSLYSDFASRTVEPAMG